MALKEYEIGDRTYLFDEEDPLLPKDAKLVSDAEVLSEVPDDADPAPAAKRGGRRANKQAEAPADKAEDAPSE